MSPPAYHRALPWVAREWVDPSFVPRRLRAGVLPTVGVRGIVKSIVSFDSSRASEVGGGLTRGRCQVSGPGGAHRTRFTQTDLAPEYSQVQTVIACANEPFPDTILRLGVGRAAQS